MLVVGFDLDMTLVDSRPGIRASFASLMADTGVRIDVDLVISRLGPKLETELANWFPRDDVERAAATYRHHYDRECRTGTIAFPGAREVFDEIRARGGQTMVVTAKSTPLAHVCLDTVGLHADVVAGLLHGLEKGDALLTHGAHAYVGDTAPDMHAARHAGCRGIGITTGTDDAPTLRAAGADVVVDHLGAIVALLDDLTV